MPAPDEATVTRLAAFWENADPTYKRMFEEMYALAPAAVSQVLSGGTWVADESDGPLASLFGGGGSQGAIPYVAINDPVEVTPFQQPTAGAPVTISWIDTNNSTVPVPAYRNEIRVYPPGGGDPVVASVDAPELAPGATAPRTYTVTGTETEGSYSVVIVTNADGVAYGAGVPGPAGYQGGSGAQFEVGQGAVAGQGFAMWGSAAVGLGGAAQDWDAARPGLVEAMNWLAAMDLTDAERAVVEGAAAKVADEEREPDPAAYGPIGARIAGALGQARGDSPELRAPMIEALRALVDLPLGERTGAGAPRWYES